MSSTSNASFSCCFWGIAETARETLLDMKILYIINIYYFLLLVNLRIKKGTGHNLQPGSINKFMGRFSFLSSSTPLRYKQKKRKITTLQNIHSRFVTKCQNGFFKDFWLNKTGKNGL